MSTDSTQKLFDAAAEFNADTFCPREGDLFVAQPLSHPEVSIEMKLIEVTRYPERSTFEGREQFSVLFQPVGNNMLQSGELCKILDDGMDWVILFLNPVSVPSEEGGSNILYEISFT